MYNSVSRCSALKIKLSPYACMLSCVQLCDPMDCRPPGPLSMGFSRWESLNGQPFPPRDNLPDAGIKPMSPVCLSNCRHILYHHCGSECACNAWDLGSVPGLGRSPGEGKGYSLQYSGLENSMDSQRVGHDWATFTSLHFFTTIRVAIYIYIYICICINYVLEKE